jgi:hypothetical protein
LEIFNYVAMDNDFAHQNQMESMST